MFKLKLKVSCKGLSHSLSEVLLITAFLSTFQQKAEVPEDVIEETLAQLRSMGYQDEGGWLMELVRAKGGDVAKVLDALHPSVDQD